MNGNCQQKGTAKFSLLPILLAFVSTLSAQSPVVNDTHEDPPLQGFTHVALTGRDGAPSGVTALVQTKDRYIWIGTPLGLYRFDGTRFSQYPFSSTSPRLPAQNITALAADVKDGLWIGYRLGGISHLTSAGLRNYGPSDGLSFNSAEQIICTPDGFVWSIAGGRLWKLEGEHWANFGKSHGLNSEGLLTVFIDSHGTVWTAEHQHIYFLRPGEANFQEQPTVSFSITQFFEPHSGDLWVSDGWKNIHRLDSSDGLIIPLQGVGAVLVDGSSLWVAEDYKGVRHVETDSTGTTAQTYEYREENGLSSNETRALIKDDEGNIWIGTGRGLDRFHASVFMPFRPKSFHSFPSIGSSPDGTIWVGLLGEPLYAIHQGGIEAVDTRNHGAGPMVVDSHGEVWLQDFWSHAIFHYGPGRIDRIKVPDALKRNSVLAMAINDRGHLLVSFMGVGIWAFDGSWRRFYAGETSDEAPTSIFVDGSTTWLGYSEGHLVRVTKEETAKSKSLQAGDIGNVLTMCKIENQLWIGGSDGVSFMDLSTLKLHVLPHVDATRGVSGIVADEFGSIWMNGGSGVVRIRHDALEHHGNLNDALRLEIFNDRYGVSGAPAQVSAMSTAIRGTGNKLWFGTEGNLYSVDPKRLPSIEMPPTIVIEGIDVNGRFWNPSDAVQLPSSAVHALSVHISAQEFTSPERVRFHYQLRSGIRGWSADTDERTINFSGLAPGSYLLSVAATNGNDLWSSPAALHFVITAAWYQTIWFYGICLLVALILIYSFYLMRIRQAAARTHELMEERVRERFRIARDLHDTLLQAMQGLMLRIDCAVQDLPSSDPTKKDLEESMLQTDEIIVEARACVQLLRQPAAEPTDLAQLMGDIARQAAQGKTTPFRVIIEGEPRRINPFVHDELRKIAKEAITNSFHHAHATVIETRLNYHSSHFEILCRDNGVGIPAETIGRGGRDGHWGLAGMSERAKALGATFDLSSSPEHGTNISIRVPAEHAYVSMRGQFSFLRWMRKLI
jgi:signal transduction histidine kinase/ligand-binding sensor domain-containing protein